jgi:hypothetical protein
MTHTALVLPRVITPRAYGLRETLLKEVPIGENYDLRTMAFSPC